MNNKETIYTVVTGDIVSSTKLSVDKLSRVMHDVTEAARKLPSLNGAYRVGKPCIIQGDRWQILLKGTSLIMHAAVAVSAAARKHGITTRLSVGVGTVEALVGDNITESQGVAFILSGRGLDLLEKRKYNPFFWAIHGEVVSFEQEMLFNILGEWASKWTPKQAEAVSFALEDVTQDNIASKLNITRQNVGKRLNGAHWKYFSSLMLRYMRE